MLLGLPYSRDLPFSDVAIRPGNVAAALLPIALIRVFVGRESAWHICAFLFMAGSTAVEFLAMIARAEGILLSWRAYLGLAGVGIAVLSPLAWWVTSLRPSPIVGRSTPVFHVALAVGAMMASVMAFRLYYWYALWSGVPDEERSLMIAGYQVHHIGSGLALTTVLGSLRLRFAKACHSAWFAVAVGVALGAVGDQIVYYALPKVTDLAYCGWQSLAGAVGFCSGYAVVLCLLWYREWARHGGSRRAETV
jgi:hypothetical protein